MQHALRYKNKFGSQHHNCPTTMCVSSASNCSDHITIFLCCSLTLQQLLQECVQLQGHSVNVNKVDSGCTVTVYLYL